MSDAGLFLALFFVGLPVSLLIAHAAGQGRKGSWAWGVLGPVGWIVAAVLGLSAKQTAALEAMQRRPAPVSAARSIDLHNACPKCGKDVVFPSAEIGKPVWCGECGQTSTHAGGQRVA